MSTSRNDGIHIKKVCGGDRLEEQRHTASRHITSRTDGGERGAETQTEHAAANVGIITAAQVTRRRQLKFLSCRSDEGARRGQQLGQSGAAAPITHNTGALRGEAGGRGRQLESPGAIVSSQVTGAAIWR